MSNEIINIPQTEIVLYQPDESTHLEVRLENQTIWLTQQQIAVLFGTQRPAITKHLSNIFTAGELDQNSVSSILEHTAEDGKTYKTKFYNLDAILSVGYRVNSKNATLFRKWATGILREHLLHGRSVHQHLVALQQQMDSRFTSLENRVAINEQQLDFFIPFDKLRVNSPTYMAYTYILRLANGQYYVGSTINLTNRIQEHNKGCDRFTRNHLPADLVYYEEYQTQEEAWKREKQLHKWSRVKKEKLINGEWTKQ